LGNTTDLPHRNIPLKGSYNIRDLGGYQTANGGLTHWKTILRSGDMHCLSPEAKVSLLDYGIRTVVDLRRDLELEEKPNGLAESPSITYIHHDLWGSLLPADRSNYETAADYWLGQYSLLIDEHRSQVCDAVSTVADPNNWPLVFHCAAGKDRTGVVAGLVLSLAGVPNNTIAEDYALSAHFLLDRFIEMTPADELPINFGWREYQQEHCPPEAMSKTLKHLESAYGGPEAYLVGGGFSKSQIESLQSAFLN